MPYHTEILFFEIFKLYYSVTNTNSLKMETLEEAFYSLQDIINSKEELAINNIFEEELQNLFETLPEAFTFEDDEIIINEDIELVFDQILMKFPTLKPIDFSIQEYIQNIIMYDSLNLPIPLQDTQELFNINRRIIQIYLSIAEHDFKDLPFLNIIKYLNDTTNTFKEKLNELDNTMLNKIKMCCAYYNSLYLQDEETFFTNANWYIILFSNNAEQLQCLGYDKLEYMTEMIDFEMNQENEEIINDFLDSENDEEYITYIESDNTIDEIPLFLTYYLIYLNNFIRNNRAILRKEVLENLLIKKYFLLSIPDLSNIEEYYLENYTIDTLELPEISKDWFTETSFETLLSTVMECALSLDYSDEDLKNKPYLQAKIIINSLFIKCFLELSVNENDKKNVLDLIINTHYYKDQNYLITSNIIDEIIFNNNLSLSL